jgi:UDP-N-acetylglucosamine acyltransferase
VELSPAPGPRPIYELGAKYQVPKPRSGFLAERTCQGERIMEDIKGNVKSLNTTRETAVVHPSAKIGQNVQIGPMAIIGENVEIGDGCIIGSNVIIDGFVRIGKNNSFYNCVSIGCSSQDYKDGKNQLFIGDANIFRENTTINSAVEGGGITKIANNNLFQAYSYIDGGCQIGSKVVMGNLTRVGSHVLVEDKAIISGLCEIHEFVRIGKMVMVGGCTEVVKDLPPFVLVDGNPLKVVGTNVVGLRRNGLETETRNEIKKAYRILYRSKLNVNQALEKIEQELINLPEIIYFTEFIRNSKLGIQSI